MLMDGTCFQRRELSLVLAILRGSGWGREREGRKARRKGEFISPPLVVVLRERETAEKVKNNGTIYNPSLDRGDGAARFDRVSMEWMPKLDISLSPLSHPCPVHLSPRLRNGVVHAVVKQTASKR